MKRLFKCVLTLLMAACSAQADLVLTVHTNVISGDHAANGPLPSFRPIRDIVITEALVDDIAVQSNRMLILDAPGWRFSRAAAVTVTATPGGDVSSISVQVLSSEVRISLTVTGAAHLDTITISGLKVRAETYESGTGRIRRPQISKDDNAVLRTIGKNSTELAWMVQTAPAWRVMAPLRIVEVTNETALLRFGVEANVPYTLEASEDLVTWTPIANPFSDTNAILLHPDPAQGAVPHRFYRLVR